MNVLFVSCIPCNVRIKQQNRKNIFLALMMLPGAVKQKWQCSNSMWDGRSFERARYSDSYGVLPLSCGGRCLMDSTSCTTYWFTPPLFNNSSGDNGRWNSYIWGAILLLQAHRARNQTVKRSGSIFKTCFRIWFYYFPIPNIYNGF